MDDQKRLTLPDPKGRKGDVFQVQVRDEDHFYLVRVGSASKPAGKAKLLKQKDGHYLGVGARPTNTEDVRQLIEEEWP